MTKLEALRSLLGKVEAGEATPDCFIVFVTPYDEDSPILRNNALGAYNGSLDAAKALHEAVLPDHGWEVCERSRYFNMIPSRFNGRYLASVGWGKCKHGEADCPACAWLIAQLKTLIAEEEAKA